jgi:hypothetical protein
MKWLQFTGRSSNERHLELGLAAEGARSDKGTLTTGGLGKHGGARLAGDDGGSVGEDGSAKKKTVRTLENNKGDGRGGRARAKREESGKIKKGRERTWCGT